MYTNIDMQIFKMASEPCVIAYRVGNHWVLLFQPQLPLTYFGSEPCFDFRLILNMQHHIGRDRSISNKCTLVRYPTSKCVLRVPSRQ